MASKNGVTIIVAGEDKTGEVFAAVNKHLQQTRENAAKTTGVLADLGSMAQTALAGAGLYIGAQQVVGAFKSLVTQTIENGMQLGRLNQQTGISTENLSLLKYAAAETGGNFDTFTKAAKKLSTELEGVHNSSKASIEAFAEAGISQKELAATGGDLWKVLELLADKFKEMPDGYQKNAAASALLGRAGQELIPILNQGSAALDELKSKAPIFSDADIEQLKKAHDATVELDAAWQGFGKDLAVQIAPALSEVLNLLANEVKTSGSWRGTTEEFDDMGRSVRGTAREIEELYAILNTADPDAVNKLHAAWAKADAAEAFATDGRDHGNHSPSVAKPPEPDGPPPPPGGGAGAGAPASAPTGDQTGNLWMMGSTTAPLSPALAEGNARQKADAADAAAVAQQKQAADLKAAMQQMEQAETDYLNHTLAVINQIQGAPTVDLKAKIGLSAADVKEIDGEMEKVAHSIFDPLFDFNESWNKKWKQTVKSLKTDLGQFMEGQLFGALFGDPNGRGGKGWMGTSFHGDTSNPKSGVASQGTGLLSDLLGSFFKKPAGVASNGGMATGAGTIPDATASLLGMGKGAASGNGGVQVIVNNTGTPQTVSQTQTSGGPDPEKMVISIFTKDLATNGPMTQGIMGLIGLM